MKKLTRLFTVCLIAALCALAFMACGDGKKEFTVTVENGTGGGAFKDGAQVTVTATIPGGKEFVAWLDGETQKSTQNPYTFTLTKDITLTATFKDVDIVVSHTHTWGEWIVTTFPTAGTGATSGIETRTCSDCQETETQSVNATARLGFSRNDAGYSVSKGTVGVIPRAVIPSKYNGLPVTAISDGGFANSMANILSAMASVFIPDSVTYIGHGAFGSCTGLTSITIPDSVTYIGSNAFYGCTGLKKLVIGNSVTDIDFGAFSSCPGLISITIPDSVTNISSYAFSDCTGLTSIIVSSKNTAYKSEGNCVIRIEDNVLVFGTKTSAIPDYVIGIGDYAFSGYSGLTSIIIPDSVTYIGHVAFGSCTGLTSIIIPDSVISIGDRAFSYCRDLKIVTIPDSVESIGNNAFSYCTGLTSVTIGNGATSIGANAFNNCVGLTSVTIGNGVTSIGTNAFNNCVGLTSITIPDNVASIGIGAFSGCTGLTSMIVSNRNTVFKSEGNCLIRIEDNVLISGTKTSVIPDYVIGIGDNAFSGCEGLTNVMLPDSVTFIGDSAFRGCTGLTNIIIPDSVTKIGNYAFSSCSGLTSVVIPDSVISIGDRAFQICTGLTSIIIPGSVISIGQSAVVFCASLTIYTEVASRPSRWNSVWNEHNRPVIWGVTLSPDQTYAVSFTKTADSISNPAAQNGISAPYRAGYAFGGWATTEGGTTAAYTAANVNTAPNGTTLYAIWMEN